MDRISNLLNWVEFREIDLAAQYQIAIPALSGHSFSKMVGGLFTDFAG